MLYLNKLIQPEVLEVLLNLLPTPHQKPTGRKRCDHQSLILGIIYVLKTGIPWNLCPNFGASYSSCYRYFREIQRRGNLKKIFHLLTLTKTNLKITAIDSTSVTSFRFNYGSGFDGKHKKCATKISTLADSNRLPADIVFGKGNIHDLNFVPSHIKNTSGRVKKILNLDKGYPSLDLRRNLRQKGIKVNMEMRTNDYKRKIGPKFKINNTVYKLRFTIERLFSWFKSFKRCKFRTDFTMSSFKAFVYLSLIIILIRG